VHHSNQITIQLENLLLDLFGTVAETGRKLMLSGGFAVDIEAASLRNDNNLTRDHKDLDVYLLDTDVPFWKDWFVSREFTIYYNDEMIDRSKGFVACSKDSKKLYDSDTPGAYWVDCYANTIEENGTLSNATLGKKILFGVTWQEMSRDVSWRNTLITVEKHEYVLAHKRGSALANAQPLREIDLHDHALFQVDPASASPKDLWAK
jgi:hypothetical protein